MLFIMFGRPVYYFGQFVMAGLFAIFTVGCSSDFSRFDMGKYIATIPSENNIKPVNRYPDNVDLRTTSSISQSYDGHLKRGVYPSNMRPVHDLETDKKPSTARYFRSSTAIRSNVDQRADLSPRSVALPDRKTLKRVSSIAGWRKKGGSVVPWHRGESLFNLSKRYGIPVEELKKANKISDSSQLIDGQNIIIPVHDYSENIPVSAPDNSPETRSNRSRKRITDESVLSKSVAIPVRSPGVYVHKSTSITKNDKLEGNDKSNVMSAGQTAYVEKMGKNAPVSTFSHYKAIDDLKVIKNGSINDEKAPQRTGLDFFRWPAIGRVLSRFGDKRDGRLNEGIDISVPEGTSVKAAENGVVIYASNELQDYGNLLLVRHGGGWVSAYAHNKTLNVKRGEKVRRGQIIARSGRTGNVTSPVLHFELRKDSVPVDPGRYLR